jgi:hypothetical protein
VRCGRPRPDVKRPMGFGGGFRDIIGVLTARTDPHDRSRVPGSSLTTRWMARGSGLLSTSSTTMPSWRPGKWCRPIPGSRRHIALVPHDWIG